MDNQQAKVTAVEYGWVAGYFDGEGSVLLNVRAKAGKNLSPKVQPMCKIQATDQEGFDRMHDILERAGIAHYIAWHQLPGFARNGQAFRQSWIIAMVGLRRSLKFLEWLTPALATKRERAEIVLRYIGLRLGHTDPRTPISDEEMSLVDRMRRLNNSKHPYSIQLNRETPGASSEKLAISGRKGALARWGAAH